MTKALKKVKISISLKPVQPELLYLFTKIKFRGNGTHCDFEGFMPEGRVDNMTDIVTEIRDMVIFVWLYADPATKSDIREITSIPSKISLSLSNVKKIVYQLDMLTNQIELFSDKTDAVFEDMWNFRHILTALSKMDEPVLNNFLTKGGNTFFKEKVVDLKAYQPQEVELEDFNYWNMSRLDTQKPATPEYCFVNCYQIDPKTGEKIFITSYGNNNLKLDDGHFNKHGKMKESVLPYLDLETSETGEDDEKCLKKSVKIHLELAYNMPHTHFVSSEVGQIYKVAQDVCLNSY